MIHSADTLTQSMSHWHTEWTCIMQYCNTLSLQQQDRLSQLIIMEPAKHGGCKKKMSVVWGDHLCIWLMFGNQISENKLCLNQKKNVGLNAIF